MINETGNWTERRETEKRPLRHRARLPPGAIVGNNVGSGSTPAATRQTTCWKCWWRTQSKSNLSPLPISLLTGKLTGNFGEPAC